MNHTAPSDNTGQNSAEPTHLVAEHTIHAASKKVFSLLADPSRHHLTEPTDWVRGSLEQSPATITEVGQVFGIEMFHVNAGGRYEMHNRVIALEPERTIAWEPAQYSADGTLETGGWTWRYDLEPAGADTRVRLTYDWSATPPEIIEQIGGMPAVGIDHLERSLEALADAVETSHA